MDSPAREESDALAEAHGELERLEAHYASLLSHVAHDLRAPLGVILGALGELESDDVDVTGEDARMLLGLVGRGARRLSHYTDNLLELSRMDTGRFQLRPSEVDLGNLVEQARERIERIEGNHPAEVAIDVPEPGAAAHLDGPRMVLLIANLMGHALQFAHRRVELSLQPHEKHVVLRVSDDGDSRDPDEVNRGLEPGPRAGGGADLGLALVGAVARVHGGRAHAEGGGEGRLHVVVEVPRRVAEASDGPSSP